jgi:hypothetical protein
MKVHVQAEVGGSWPVSTPVERQTIFNNARGIFCAFDRTDKNATLPDPERIRIRGTRQTNKHCGTGSIKLRMIQLIAAFPQTEVRHERIFLRSAKNRAEGSIQREILQLLARPSVLDPPLSLCEVRRGPTDHGAAEERVCHRRVTPQRRLTIRDHRHWCSRRSGELAALKVAHGRERRRSLRSPV